MQSRSFHRWLVVAPLCVFFADTPRLQSPSLEAQLLAATQNGDVALVAALLAKGVAVDARTEFELTPLMVAADKGNGGLVKLLVSRGADVNAKDHTYGKTPLKAAITSWADLRGDLGPRARKDRGDIIDFLLESGAHGGEALAELILAGYVEAARRVISGGNVDQTYLNLALLSARRAGASELSSLLRKSGAAEPAPEDNARSVERLKLLAGTYRSRSGEQLTLTLLGENLLLDLGGLDRMFLLPLDLTMLRSRDRKVVVALKAPKVPPTELTLTNRGSSEVFVRITAQ